MTTPPREAVRYLEARFACAQACGECARACALRASVAVAQGARSREALRRTGVECAEACEATCGLLSAESEVTEDGLRLQVEWCRERCLESAAILAGPPGGTDTAAEGCRACARACADFLKLL
ncbi:ferredoxin [Streptomyces sp. NPDC088789]|uniref:ferredoxin n=1 Tax=Streptomyces sp. NPDC088789 TaxID=3365899 RepID=UPI00382F739D